MGIQCPASPALLQVSALVITETFNRADYLGMPIQEKLFYYEIKFWIFPTKCLQHTLVAHVDEIAVFLSGYIFSKSELHMYLEIYSSHTQKKPKKPHNFTVEDFI